MTLAERCAAVRAGAGLFDLPDWGVLCIEGDDRVRWLDGMVTNDVGALDARGPGAVCRALALTRQGRIVAEFRVWHAGDALLLPMPRAAIAPTVSHLDAFIIADDVSLRDASDEVACFALEGPRSHEVLAAVGGKDAPDAGSWVDVAIDGAAVRAAGASLIGGEPAAQLLVPASDADAVRTALLDAGAPLGLVAGDADTLDCLRIEAGEPWMGRELDGSVLPAEVGLDEAVSDTKGCYTGQEVVARMRSRGRANHRLVGLRLEGEGPGAADRALRDGDKSVGEITSWVDSPTFGPIGLGFVKADRCEPGTTLRSASGAAVVAALPFQ